MWGMIFVATILAFLISALIGEGGKALTESLNRVEFAIMALTSRTKNILIHLASRPGHDEVKADFLHLMLEEFGAEHQDLNFERRVPEVKGRLDALIGRTILEAKSDLMKEWADVERRMPDYLADREREEKERFTGIATDGLKWAVFERAGNGIRKIKETTLIPDKGDEFLAWLDGVIAIKSSLPPDALTIRAELGQDSVAYHRASHDMLRIWQKIEDQPATALKRQLWASLLKLVYGKEIENDILWFQHTYLVVVAKSIALAVLGVNEDDPKAMLSGDSFRRASILGAVESDFFDWIIADPEGEALVRRIMTHVRRFRLHEVESDVMKVLYESLIDAQQRHGLGEYYTPDWLAAKVVREAVDRPVEQNVLDPACGSGSFLFHAVRNYLREAVDADITPDRRASLACTHVAGLDIHPVAVIIARVTYLLALAPVLSNRKGTISIPVYLGDAMQMSVGQNLADKELVIVVPPSKGNNNASGNIDGQGREMLQFPDVFCRQPELFDKLIEHMRQSAEQDLNQTQANSIIELEVKTHVMRGLTDEEQRGVADMTKAYGVMSKLKREGRDTVWSYVARNLSKPLAYSSQEGWANVLVGNPPWIAFRHMSADLQKRFKELAKSERLYVGGKLATQNDFCALFTVRAAALYLHGNGRLGFVLPLAALTRGQYERFQSGSFTNARLAYDQVWTMDETVKPLFPVPSCVVFARKRAVSRSMPDKVRAYSGSLPLRDAPEGIADDCLTVEEGVEKPSAAKFTGGSKYRQQFKQGATLVPRMLCLVDRVVATSRLGMASAKPHVRSRRSSLEKKPWIDLPSIEARVEEEFLRPVLLGESILPYRMFKPFEGVIPVNGDGAVLSADAAAGRGYSGLLEWMQKAEQVWNSGQESSLNFAERVDYHGGLSNQFPIAINRVVYAASGIQMAACRIDDQTAVIEHALYSMECSNAAEARYLVCLLNAEEIRLRVESMQAKGQWGARHFDKVMFNLPIPIFDPKSGLHVELAEAGDEAEHLVASIIFPDDVKFQRARKMVREALAVSGVSQRIGKLVARLLD
jgi:N-6 DNA Methylase